MKTLHRCWSYEESNHNNKEKKNLRMALVGGLVTPEEQNGSG